MLNLILSHFTVADAAVAAMRGNASRVGTPYFSVDAWALAWDMGLTSEAANELGISLVGAGWLEFTDFVNEAILVLAQTDDDILFIGRELDKIEARARRWAATA